MTRDLEAFLPDRSEPGWTRLAETRSLAAAINEHVRLRAHDPAWAAAFDLERTRLQALLPGAFLAIEHIGSTAVAGLLAKPVVDIMAGVASLDDVDARIARLCDNGYTTSAEFNATLSDRKWLMRWLDGRRTHHLHIVVHGEAQWVDRLAFRDALRSDPALAARYAELKVDLAATHASDREAYGEAKAGFVRAVVVGVSARDIDCQPGESQG
jgi:GrpB-like predicted nucleotidyltransferase (UPF0157 family)